MIKENSPCPKCGEELKRRNLDPKEREQLRVILIRCRMCKTRFNVQLDKLSVDKSLENGLT